jgi:hypothetical protein
MWHTLSTRQYIAKKKHRDDGFNEVRDWVFNSWQFNELPVDQRTIIMEMVNAPNAHLIMPGDRYNYSFSVGDGEKSVFKSKERFSNIIHKFKLYHED